MAGGRGTNIAIKAQYKYAALSLNFLNLAFIDLFTLGFILLFI